MHNQLSNVIYLSNSFLSEEKDKHEYDELIKSIKKLIEYVESRKFAEGINSLLGPCVEKLKSVLIKVNSVIKRCPGNFDGLIYCFEKLSAIIKLFSNALKFTDAIEKLYSISQVLMAKMINDAPRSTECVLKNFVKGNAQKPTLNTPFYIAKEAFFMSKKSLYRVGKELEYAKVMGNKSMIYLINDKIKSITEERMALEDIMDAAFKISERYILLINEAECTAKIIEEELSRLCDQVDRLAAGAIRKPAYKLRANLV